MVQIDVLEEAIKHECQTFYLHKQHFVAAFAQGYTVTWTIWKTSNQEVTGSNLVTLGISFIRGLIIAIVTRLMPFSQRKSVAVMVIRESSHRL